MYSSLNIFNFNIRLYGIISISLTLSRYSIRCSWIVYRAYSSIRIDNYLNCSRNARKILGYLTYAMRAMRGYIYIYGGWCTDSSIIGSFGRDLWIYIQKSIGFDWTNLAMGKIGFEGGNCSSGEGTFHPCKVIYIFLFNLIFNISFDFLINFRKMFTRFFQLSSN